MGNRVFGCDICQEVCPFNGVRAQTSRNAAFLPRPGLDLTLEQLLCMTAEEYGQLFANSAVRRAKLTGLRRNAEAALRHRKG
jgi:epoxyqueuosine reductase